MFFAPVSAYLEALVHRDARHDSLVAARHRAFLAAKLFSGLAVLAALPAYLAWRGAPGVVETLAIVWMLSPLMIVWYLSRTGNYARAHIISAVALAALIGVIGSATGGLNSFVAPWIPLIALEATLSASRRLITATISLAVLTAFGLWVAGFYGWFPAFIAGEVAANDQAKESLVLLGVVSAAVYGGAIALANSAFVRAGHDVKRLSEARYQLLAQNMSDVIARHGRDGAVTFISPAVEQLTGLSPAQLLGHKLFDRVHIADRPAFLNAVSDAARDAKPASVEYRLKRETAGGKGEFIWVEMRCRAIGERDAAHAAGHQVVSVIRDITARKLDAIALEEARADLERANDAKSKFLATVSHELRTPLNAIIGFSEMLEREQELKLDVQRREDYARLIRDSGEHLLAVVNGILDMSRIEAGHFEIVTEPFALKPLIESCRQMMSLRAEQGGIQLFAGVPGDLPEINADPRALRQVVINLVSNAIKFTERGGKVDINARAVAGGVEICVSDNGVGIPEADLVRLGDPFFQGRSSYDRAYEGTGLGLSVVMGLVKLHGGSVEIESRLHKGTNVLVRLPLDCQRAVASPASRIAKFPSKMLSNGAPRAEAEMVKKSA